MSPNATPQTATRRTRSQSPPRRTQRTPVSQIAAAIASSSISPYMWIVTGPRSIVPLCGEGMYARLTGGTFSPRAATPASDHDLDRGLPGAALLDQLDRPVRVDGAQGGTRAGVGWLVPRADPR